jgi:glycosyltransferase involved in cell wall biosynthesis
MTPLRVVSLLDAAGVTGPAKNLIQFCGRAKSPEGAGPPVEVSVATIRRAGEHSAGLEDGFVGVARAAGIEVDVLTERFRYDTRVIEQLKDTVGRRKPDILETHGVRMHFLARLSGLVRTIPWVAFHHGYTAEDLKMQTYNQLDRWSLRGAARVFTDCRPFADQLAGMGIRRERIRVLGSSIEVRPGAGAEEVRAVAERHGIASGEPVILSVGRLSREKGQADLIAAAGHLAAAQPNLPFRLVLVGDGPERGRLEKAAAASGLSRPIVFAGQQTDVLPYYGLARVFVLPSLSEGSPNVLLEAMAAGVPIVATSVGGVPEMVEHETSALLAPARNPQALATQIGRILSEATLADRLTRNSSAVVSECYSPEAYRRTVVQAYVELRTQCSPRF